MKALLIIAAAALALSACVRAGPHGPPKNASANVDTAVASDEAVPTSDGAMSSDAEMASDMIPASDDIPAEGPDPGNGPHGPPAG
jgi:hypothetical protein